MTLWSIRQLFGTRLGGSDGEIGRVKDFYLDDKAWAVRYLIADTGSWLPGRQVLISPHAFGGFHQMGALPVVSLTRHQIESSPWFETGRRISRLEEEKYHQYYGWPCYWRGDDLWGMSASPSGSLPTSPLESGQSAAAVGDPEPAAVRLRSTRTLKGYSIQTSDATAGRLCDFLVDPKNWALAQLVVKTGRRFSGPELQIPASSINRISDQDSTIFVNLSKDGLEGSPPFDRHN
jgi:hypothetical protein